MSRCCSVNLSRFPMRLALVSVRNETAVKMRLPMMPAASSKEYQFAALQSGNAIAGHYTANGLKRLKPVRNVRFGKDEGASGNLHNPFIRATTSRWRQLRLGHRRNVHTNNGKISVCQLPNIGATAQGGRLQTARMRIRAKALQEHEQNMTIVISTVNSF